MTAPTFDPTTTVPIPPTESNWPQAAPGPPSPFPWSTAGPVTPPATPSLDEGADRLSPPRASPSQAIGSSHMLRAGSADSGYAGSVSLSPASAKQGTSSKAGGSRWSPRLGLGERRPSYPLHKIGPVRTPSGFEFLDWGDAAVAGQKQNRSL